MSDTPAPLWEDPNPDPNPNPADDVPPEAFGRRADHAGAAVAKEAGLTWLNSREDCQDYAAQLAPVKITTQQGDTLLLGEQSEMSLIWARAGTGKTWLVSWMAERLAAAGVRSLILVTEGLPALARRQGEMDWPHNPELHPRLVRVTRNDIQYNPKAIIEMSADCGAVFLDVVSALFSHYDENSSAAWNTTREILNPIIGDRLFVAVHHSGKSNYSDEDGYPGTPRGTSRLLDDAAYDFKVRSVPDGCAFTSGSKSRGAARPLTTEMFLRFPKEGSGGCVTEMDQPGGDARRLTYDPSGF